MPVSFGAPVIFCLNFMPFPAVIFVRGSVLYACVCVCVCVCG